MTKKSTRQLVLMSFLLYISLGLPDFIFGGAWPILHEQLHLNVELISLVTAVSLGFSLLANVIFMHITMKIDKFLFLATMALVAGLGLVFFAKEAWAFFLAIPFIGIGQGSIDIAINNFIASRYSSRVMNLLHACFGLGVTLSTILISLSIALTNDIRLAVLIVIGLHLAILLHFLRYHHLFLKNKNRIRFKKNPTKLTAQEWLFPLFAFLYAIEQVFGIFLASYLVFKGYSASFAALVTGLFWFSIMSGRFIGAYLGKFLSSRQQILVFSFLSLLGCSIFAFSTLLPLAAIIIGLGFGPLYPIFVEKPYSLFEYQIASKITGFNVQAATLGVLCVPIVYSLLIERLSFQYFSFFLIGNLLLLLLVEGLLWNFYLKEN